MAGKGGGAWKVAYADFVTAMMAFFMVMWITGQNEKTKEAVSSYFQDPFAKSGESTGPASARPAAAIPPPHRRGEQGKRPGVKTAPSEPSGLGTTILFAASSAGSRRRIANQHLDVARARAWRAFRSASKFAATPRGALAQPKRAIQRRVALSYARCQATMEFLAEHGIEPERMRLSQARCFQPATNAESAERQRENERVEVFVLREFVSPRHRGAAEQEARGGSRLKRRPRPRRSGAARRMAPPLHAASTRPRRSHAGQASWQLAAPPETCNLAADVMTPAISDLRSCSGLAE